MNKITKLLFISIVTLSTSALLASCKQESKTPTEEKTSSNFTLSASSKNLIFGDVFELTAIYEPKEGESLHWESDDERVVLVNEGTVTAVGIGSTTVTCTYMKQSLTCDFTVSYGDYLPSLSVEHLTTNELGLTIGSTFNVNGQVFFNNNYYPCVVSGVSSNENVAKYSNGKIIALSEGETTITLNSSWKNFSGSLLQRELVVTVTKDIAINTVVDFGDYQTSSNIIEMSLVSSFCGKTYYSSGVLSATCKVNGVEATPLITYEDNGVISLSDEGVINALNVGEALISLSYEDEGILYSSFVNIKVTCPVETYQDNITFCAENDFPVETYFGKGAKIISASQAGKELTIKRGKLISGITCNGSDTLPIEIQTTLGGYVFTNLFVYDRVLTPENIVSTLLLGSGVVRGYYILDSDIISPVDFTLQQQSNYAANDPNNTYFAGTIDGQGHKLTALVGKEGIFGGLGENAVVKNIHFHFVFKPDNNTKVAVGLARNNATFIQSEWAITLSNVKITASQFVAGCYAMFDMKFLHTIIDNVYVDLTGSGIEKLPEFTNCFEQEYGCLFHIDACLMNGPESLFKGDWNNFYIVTGTERFLPIACGTWINSTYVSYAKNDIDNEVFGHVNHHVSKPNNGYCILVYDEESDNRNYFGNIPTNLNGGPKVAWCYYAQGDKAEWGAWRFNNNQDLVETVKINKIGSWVINVTD